MTSLRSSHTLSRSEWALISIALVLAALALWGPDVAHLQPRPHHTHGGEFADARMLWGIPHAMDVVSNLPFLFFGALGLWRVRSVWHQVARAQRQAAGLFFAGLITTFFGSAYFHWAPDALGLMADRMGMGLAFAGVVGLAVAERVSARAAGATSFVTFVSALAAAAWCAVTADVLPWACVQFGGLLLVLVCAFLPRQANSLGVNWQVLVMMYALAKVLEGFDAQVFEASGQLLSGHSLKHMVASLAAWPVLSALRPPMISASKPE